MYLFRDKSYVQYGVRKTSDKAKQYSGSLFSKRIGSYVTSHGYAEAHARQLIHNAALTGNGLVRSKYFCSVFIVKLNASFIRNQGKT